MQSVMKKLLRIALYGIAFCAIALAVLLTVRSIRASNEARAIAKQTTEITLLVAGTSRRALVHLPKNAMGTAPLPLVLMLHGMGGTAENVIKETGWMAKADAEDFIVAFPEATRPDMNQPAKFGRNSPAWNDGSGRFQAGKQDVPDVAFIAALLDHLEAKFAVDRQRIFVVGFSNGASMTFRVGAELSERIAAIAPVAGAFWLAEPKATRAIPMLYITGTNDKLNPMAGGLPSNAAGEKFKDAPEKPKPPVRESVTRWAQMIGCSPSPQSVSGTADGITTEVYRGGRDGTEVIFTTIADQGHVWPGAASPLPEFMVGKATQRLMATDAVWEFFKAHPLKP
jgi:polyhydroxybutyrate depolymerase